MARWGIIGVELTPGPWRFPGVSASANGGLPPPALWCPSCALAAARHWHAGGGGSSRLCVFTPQGIPLQLAPPECGGLGGLATDGDWIYALDSQKGHVLAFTAKAPAALGSPAALRRRPSLSSRPPPVRPRQRLRRRRWSRNLHTHRRRNPAGPVAHFLRPSLAAIRQRFREGHVVAKKNSMRSTRKMSNAAAAKAVVESLRRRRAGEVLTAAEDSQIEQADVEQRRIAVLAEGSLIRCCSSEAHISWWAETLIRLAAMGD